MSGGIDLQKMTEAELLRYLLTAGNVGSSGSWGHCETIEAMHVAMDDLQGLYQAVASDDTSSDLAGVIHRARMRLEVAAELARRGYDKDRKAPGRRGRVVPIKSEPGSFSGGPTS